MVINRKYFPDVLPDNEEMYFQFLIGSLESIDELSSLQISKLRDSYHFRLSPSIPKYSKPLLEEILSVNNLLGIKLDLSKRIKTSGVIDFKIILA